MARRQVVHSTCDRCHKEVTTPFVQNRRGEEFEVPDGWIHIAANGKSTTLFEMDLCDDCKGIVIEAAGMADRTRS